MTRTTTKSRPKNLTMLYRIILDKMTGEQFMAIPDVYESVREHFNDAALDLAMAKFHTP